VGEWLAVRAGQGRQEPARHLLALLLGLAPPEDARVPQVGAVHQYVGVRGRCVRGDPQLVHLLLELPELAHHVLVDQKADVHVGPDREVQRR
jgi:hypothetical protein